MLFKGVHYEMIIDTGEFSSRCTPPTHPKGGGGPVGDPFNIHIMRPMPVEIPEEEEAEE